MEELVFGKGEVEENFKALQGSCVNKEQRLKI